MKRALLTLLAALLLLLPSPTSTLASPPAIPLVTQVMRSIVLLEQSVGEETHPICTAFVVMPGIALTVAHCLPEANEDLFTDGLPSHVLKHNDSLGLVSVADLKKPALSIRKEEALVGEEVRTFGYAWGEMNVFRRTVSSFKGPDFLMDSPLAPGMSGGPTVDTNGEVVGVNQAANSVVGVGCGVREIKAFLK